jgi:hypothetical protein
LVAACKDVDTDGLRLAVPHNSSDAAAPKRGKWLSSLITNVFGGSEDPSSAPIDESSAEVDDGAMAQATASAAVITAMRKLQRVFSSKPRSKDMDAMTSAPHANDTAEGADPDSESDFTSFTHSLWEEGARQPSLLAMGRDNCTNLKYLVGMVAGKGSHADATVGEAEEEFFGPTDPADWRIPSYCAMDDACEPRI